MKSVDRCTNRSLKVQVTSAMLPNFSQVLAETESNAVGTLGKVDKGVSAQQPQSPRLPLAAPRVMGPNIEAHL